jgi:two-component SAPR family response regulator
MRSAYYEFLCLIVEADFHYRDDEQSAGRSSAREAFALGRRLGLLGGDWWRRDVIARVCSHALSADIEIEFARRLIRVHRLVPDANVAAPRSWPWPVKIRVLGGFSLEVEDKPVDSRSRVRKPLALLKALVAFGGSMTDTQIADTLWPDADGDAAHGVLAVTVHRARKLLCDEAAIRRHDGKIDLDPAKVWTDVRALEAAAERAGRTPVLDPSLSDLLIELYRGPFLAGEDDSWILGARDRIRARLYRHVMQMAAAYEKSGAPDRAAICYLTALESDPGGGEARGALAALYHRLGQQAS